MLVLFTCNFPSIYLNFGIQVMLYKKKNVGMKTWIQVLYFDFSSYIHT